MRTHFSVHQVTRQPSNDPRSSGARDATIATATLPPGSLQRMVRRRLAHFFSMNLPVERSSANESDAMWFDADRCFILL